MATTPRINVDNHLMWGRLVKSWATGLDYVNHEPTAEAPVPPPVEDGMPVPFPRPSSFRELVRACLPHGVGLHFVPTRTKTKTYCTGEESMGFVLMQGTSEISILRLPPKEKIQESEHALLGANGNTAMNYALPDFYAVAFGTPQNPAQMRTFDLPEKMDFHAERVGEYTINTCM